MYLSHDSWSAIIYNLTFTQKSCIWFFEHFPSISLKSDTCDSGISVCISRSIITKPQSSLFFWTFIFNMYYMLYTNIARHDINYKIDVFSSSHLHICSRIVWALWIRGSHVCCQEVNLSRFLGIVRTLLIWSGVPCISQAYIAGWIDLCGNYVTTLFST